MIRELRLLAFIVVSILFSGCLRTYYPLFYGSKATPMIFQPANSVNETQIFYGGDITLANGWYENESLALLKGSYSTAKTRDYSNFNSRLFGYAATYKAVGVYSYDYVNNFYTEISRNGTFSGIGFGGELGYNINFKFWALKAGLGLSIGAATEFGSYYNWRKNADKDGIIDSEDGWIFLYLSMFPVLAYEISEKRVISLQVNIGYPGLLSPSLAYNLNGKIFWLSYVPGFACAGLMVELK